MRMTAQLVKKTHNQRFYKLSRKITKGRSSFSGKELDLITELKDAKEKTFKPEYKHLCPLDGFDIICISDAHTHVERIVFGAIKFEDGEYSRTRIQIGGNMTFLIHGGDSRSVYSDETYIKILAKDNGFDFHHSDLIAESVCHA